MIRKDFFEELHTFFHKKSADDLKGLFLFLKKHFSFSEFKEIVLLAARDITKIHGVNLEKIENSLTYRALFDNLKEEFPFLSENREMIYFLLIGIGLKKE